MTIPFAALAFDVLKYLAGSKLQTCCKH